MKKIMVALVLIFSVNSVCVAGSGGWYENFLKGLKSRVQQHMQSRNRVSAVAAVRGARQGGDPRALYWKGGVSDAAAKKLDAERKQLAGAVQLVVDGDDAAGKTALEKFIKENPESIFLSEVKEALEKLPAAPAPPAQTAEPAGEAVEPAAEPESETEAVKPVVDAASPAEAPETPVAPAESGADTGGASE